MLKLTILLIFVCPGFVLSLPALDEESAKKYIDDSSEMFSELYENLVGSAFSMAKIVENVDIKNFSCKERAEMIKILSSVSAEFVKFQKAAENLTALAQETYRFPVEQFNDEEVKIGIMKLKTRPAFLLYMAERRKKLFEVAEDANLRDLDDFLAKQNYCEYKSNQEKCTGKYSNISKIMSNSKNPDEILYFWKELRHKNVREVTKLLNEFIQKTRQISEKYKTSAKFVWYRDYLDENFGDEMEKVIIELEPLYKELHAYIRHVLHEQYGEIVPADGLIPHHLYEQILSQAWQPNSYSAKEFKGVKMLNENNFNETAKQVIDIASNFMKSLGLSDLPEDFLPDHTLEKTSDSDDCETRILDSGKMSWLIYCKDVHIKSFLQMHGYVARLYYANERKNVPFAYSKPYNFELPTGEAVILSSTTPKYLHQIGHKESPILTPEEDMNRLFRMGVHTLLSVPEYFVHVKVVADVLDNTIPITEMNKHYWDLMKKYLGVASPIDTTPEAIDFPHKFYKNIELNGQSIKFVSEIIGYQIYKSLCEKSGEYIKGDKTHLLHNCNFYNSKDVGETLKQMMQLGAKKPWKKLLSVITGDETGMKADGMLEYFEPLKKWLHTKNTEHGVKVGW